MIKHIGVGVVLTVFGWASPAAADVIDAEKTQDAGADYATALRIRLATPLSKPKGKSGQWFGVLAAGDRVDAYKFSPTPVRGQMLVIGINSVGGPVSARLVDRKTGETVAEATDQNGISVLYLIIERGVMLVIEHGENAPEQAYAVSAVLTKPAEMGIPTVDQATKAFAEAMKSKPKMAPPPEGFSIIVPKKKAAGS
ncbi:MAG: hypothetical protein JKY60_06565 [Kordiimonadaceae bacterium]|nr:hypothetical protein [Kordiimonadaceae bacterium]